MLPVRFKKLARRQAGFVDPLSLAALGFLVLSLLVGSFVVSDKGRSFSPFKKAASEIAEPCKVCSSGKCTKVASSPKCSDSLNECSTDSTCATPKPPFPPPQVPATTSTSETGLDAKEISSGNPPPQTQQQDNSQSSLSTTVTTNITTTPTSLPTSTPTISKEKASNLDKAEEEIDNLSLNLSQPQINLPSSNPSSTPVVTTPTSSPKSFLPTPTPDKQTNSYLDGVIDSLKGTFGLKTPTPKPSSVPTPTSFPTPSLSPYQDCVQKRGPSECTALIPENQRKYQEYISSLVGTTGTAPLPQSGVKTIGQTCKENSECESGNCQSVPRGRVCLAKGTKYAPLVPEGAITLNPVPITISTTSSPNITPRSIDYKKYEDACKGKVPGTICNIDNQAGACSRGAVPLCGIGQAPPGNLANQVETAVIDTVSNLPLVGPNRIYQSLQIAASGSQYSQEAVLPDLYAPGGVRKVKIGAGEVALAHYAGLTDIADASNRLFYQTGLSESQAQEYNAYVANRFSDAATVGAFAVGTAAQITSPFINPQTLAGKPISSTYQAVENRFLGGLGTPDYSLVSANEAGLARTYNPLNYPETKIPNTTSQSSLPLLNPDKAFLPGNPGETITVYRGVGYYDPTELQVARGLRGKLSLEDFKQNPLATQQSLYEQQLARLSSQERRIQATLENVFGEDYAMIRAHVNDPNSAFLATTRDPVTAALFAKMENVSHGGGPFVIEAQVPANSAIDVQKTLSKTVGNSGGVRVGTGIDDTILRAYFHKEIAIPGYLDPQYITRVTPVSELSDDIIRRSQQLIDEYFDSMNRF